MTRFRLFTGLCAVLLAVVLPDGRIASAEPAPAGRLLAATPAAFVENPRLPCGAAPAVGFAYHGSGANVFHAAGGPVFEVFARADAAAQPDLGLRGPRGLRPAPLDAALRSHVFAVAFPGSRRAVPVGAEPLPGRVNYFIGSDPAAWHTGAATYAGVVYPELWDGIDLHTFGRRSALKYEFHVAPGADSSRIVLAYEGVSGLSLDDDGSLRIVTPLGDLVDAPPVAWQVVAGREVRVPVRYRLVGPASCGFELAGGVDPARELVIDPEIGWSTFVGGAGEDAAWAVTTDSLGGIYVTGTTESTDFPTTVGTNRVNAGLRDVFVTKMTSAGALQWSTYIGGSAGDSGRALDLDPTGAVIVVGQTASSNFPAVNAFDTFFNGGESDGFIVRLNSSGQLQWASFLGGASRDEVNGVVCDPDGAAWLTGRTASTNFPTSLGFGAIYSGGDADAYVAKVTSQGNLVWATFLGGIYEDCGMGIARDAEGSFLIAGYTRSTNFPSVGGFQRFHQGLFDAFVTKLTSTGGYTWSTYLGGSADDFALALAVDSDNNTIVTGYTESDNFPTIGGFDTVRGGWGDAFVTKLSPMGTIRWSSYLGGGGRDEARAVAVDSFGNIFVAGSTDSTDLTVTDAFDASYNGNIDAFLAKIDTAIHHVFGTYIGGSGMDCACGLALDSTGAVALAGITYSADFPTAWAYDASQNGEADAFVMKVAMVVRHLDVQSAPVPGVAIAGDKPGTTPYIASCPDRQLVTLAAPAVATIGGVRYDFVRWVLDLVEQTAGVASLSVTMAADHDAVANYRIREHVLSVKSAPFADVPITGDKPGTTNYTAVCVDQQVVNLTAPASRPLGADTYAFAQWAVNGVAQPRGIAAVAITMQANTMAEASYELSPPTVVSDLAATVASTDLAATAIASSGEYSATFAASKAFDGLATTCWSTPVRTAPQAEYIVFDLGSVKTFHGIKMLPSASFPQLFPSTLSVDLSDDNATWVCVVSQGGYTAVAGAWYEKNFASRSARYVRVGIAHTRLYQSNAYLIQIAEVRVFQQHVELDFTSRGGVTLDIRHANAAISGAVEWAAATPLDTPPAPLPYGTRQTIEVAAGDLPAERLVHLALKSTDSLAALSDLSNSASVTTPGTPPGRVTNLAVSGVTADSLTVSFTASGDDGASGTAASYDLRWSTEAISGTTWPGAQAVVGEPAPSAPGTPESITITGLTEDVTYHVALRVFDDAGNESALSNVVSGKTSDVTDPAASTLFASLMTPGTQVKLTVASAAASGVYSAAYPAANALDGSSSTVWSTPTRSAAQAEWLTLDLGQVETVEKIRLLPAPGTPQLFPADFTIDASNDNVTYVQVASQASCVAQAGTWYEKTFTPWSARYLRISIAAGKLWQPGQYYIQIAEAEVYGTQRLTKIDFADAAGSGDYSAAYPAANTTDGRADTVWSTPVRTVAGPEFLTLDVGRTESIEKVCFLPSAAAPQLFPAAFKIQLSTNGADWTDAATEAGYAPQAGVWYSKTIAPASARYVKLAVTATPAWAPNVFLMQLAEAEVYALNHSAKLAAAAATSSGAYSATYGADKAIDGNASTIWSTTVAATAQAASLTVDLGSAQSVEKVRLLPSASAPQLFPSDFTVALSTDGNAWTSVATAASYAPRAGVWYAAGFDAANARYVRLATAATRYYSPGVYMLQVAEFEVYQPVQQVVHLNWLSAGDNANSGTPASYDVRWNTAAVTGATWGASTALAGEPAAQPAGTPRSMDIPLAGLPSAQRIYFGLVTLDEASNQSAVSNSPYIDLPEHARPLALPGDATTDCTVNVLDLLFVRNRIGQSVSTGDNAAADVNRDGLIDIRDLLLVRDRMNDSCP